MTAAGQAVAAGHTDQRPGTGRVWRVAGFPIWPPAEVARALMARRLAREVLLLQGSNTLQKLYGVVYNVAGFRLLGDTGYGQYLLVGSLYNTLNLLGTLGLGQFLVVPLAQAAAAGDRRGVARATGYNLKLSLCIAVGVLALALAIGPWLGELVYQGEQGRMLGGWMRLAALGAVPSVVYSLAVTSLSSVGRLKELAIVENVDGVLYRGFGIAALIAGYGVPGMLAGAVAGGALSACFALYQYRRVVVRDHGFPDVGALVMEAIRVPFGAYFRFSALAIVDKNVAQFFGQTPLLFLGRWAGPEQAAYFGVAAKLYTLLNAFHGAASRAISLRLSQEFGAHGAAATRRMYWRTLLVWGAISTVGALAFTCFLPVFKLIYGAEAFPSLTLVLLFAALAAKQGFTVTLGTIYLIANRVATNAMVKLPLIALAMPAGAWLVQQYGAVGAAAYQLGAFVAGDVVYFSIIASPWFWRAASQAKADGASESTDRGQAADTEALDLAENSVRRAL